MFGFGGGLWRDEFPSDKRCPECGSTMSGDLDRNILICDRCKGEIPWNGEFVFHAFQRIGTKPTKDTATKETIGSTCTRKTGLKAESLLQMSRFQNDILLY